MKHIEPTIKSSLVTVVTACAFMLFPDCASDIPGGGSEAGNARITGMVTDIHNSPAENVIVQISPSDYDPVRDEPVADSYIDTTGEDGIYRIEIEGERTYTIQAVQIDSRERGLFPFVEPSEDDTIPDFQLRKPGTLRVRHPDAVDSGSGYLYIPGTTYKAEFAGYNEFIQLDSVPAGNIPSVFCVSYDNEETITIDENIMIPPGGTATLAFQEWAYSKKIILNTSPTGADIGSDVYRFPVLIRLNDSNFDFTQAQSGGEDIRFSKPDGSMFFHEIERWDMAQRKAEIWVSVDTVFGNDSMQHITMFWGNSAANGSSSSTNVFDTAVGFLGVWHLGEQFGPIVDATVNGFNGTITGNQAQVDGHVGFGQYFNGSGDYTEIMDVPNPDTSGVTVCAWVKLSAVETRQTIISKSLGGLPSSSYGWLVTFDEYGSLQAFASSDTGIWGKTHTFVLTSSSFVTDTTTWHHVAVIINRTGNENCRLFIDGADVTVATAAEITTVGSIVSPMPMRIGSEGSGEYPWFGALDELSVSYRVRSSDWVLLSYMNQREDDKLVVFK